MNAIERLIAYGLLALVLVIGVPWYFEHRGAAECKANDKAVVAKAEIHNTQVETTQKADDKKAGETLNAALTDPIGALPALPPSLPVASCASPVPHPRGNPRQGPPTVTVRTEAPASVVQPSWNAFERSDVQDSHDADAEVTYLRTLLVNQYRLCGGK